MADYDGQWIEQLNPADPVGTEKKSLGDNAIREIKTALKNAFPNSPIGDQYTGTFSQLDQLVADSTLPRDMIVPYIGNVTGDGPPGWTICDGRIRKSGGGNAPDLQGIFLRGWYVPFNLNIGDTGGSPNVQVSGQQTNGTSISAAQLPNLSNNISVSVAPATSSDSHNATTFVAGGSPENAVGVARTQPMSTTGLNGSPHTHNFSINDTSGANNPAYYTVSYLIKD